MYIPVLKIYSKRSYIYKSNRYTYFFMRTGLLFFYKQVKKKNLTTALMPELQIKNVFSKYIISVTKISKKILYSFVLVQLLVFVVDKSSVLGPLVLLKVLFHCNMLLFLSYGSVLYQTPPIKVIYCKPLWQLVFWGRGLQSLIRCNSRSDTYQGRTLTYYPRIGL